MIPPKNENPQNNIELAEQVLEDIQKLPSQYQSVPSSRQEHTLQFYNEIYRRSTQNESIQNPSPAEQQVNRNDQNNTQGNNLRIRLLRRLHLERIVRAYRAARQIFS